MTIFHYKYLEIVIGILSLHVWKYLIGSVHSISIDNGEYNLLFIKLHKCSSSTASGILRRIAAHHHMGGYDIGKYSRVILPEPLLWVNSSSYSEVRKQSGILSKKIFLVSWVRNPHERCLSEFYHFYASRSSHEKEHQATVTDDAKMQYLSNKCTNKLHDFLDPHSSTTRTDAETWISIYQFIGLTERFEESALVLAYKLQLSLCDILYIKSKDSSSQTFDDRGFPVVKHMKLSEESKELKAFINGTFLKNNALDYVLYNLVDSRLNKDIALINERENNLFDAWLQIFKKYLKIAESTCMPNTAQTSLMNATECYFNDNGCGYKCLDNLCDAHPILFKSIRDLRRNDADDV